ncbi:MAG: plasmid mobilization relaxosome protein MobC [Desulfurivibrionaceae bacterium]|jgi:predicted transcriptional regulator
MTQYVPVRLDDDQARKLDERATTEKNRSVVIRRALDAYLSDRTPGEHAGLAELTKAVKDFQADMARVGGNLNQIAHYYNIHDTIQPHELAAEHKELRRQFQALMTLIKKIHEQLRTF